MKVSWKRISAVLLTAVLVFTLIPAQKVKAADTNDENVKVRVEKDVTYTSKEAILKRINEIRYEACKEGVTIYGTTLTPDDYVPVKWSYDLEEIAIQRAAEASYSFSHTRPDGSSCFSATSSSGQQSWGEGISSMREAVAGINHFYMEKQDLVNNTGRETGHYVALINPNLEYVGIGVFDVTVAEYSPYPGISENRIAYENERRVSEFEVAKEDLTLNLTTEDYGDVLYLGEKKNLDLTIYGMEIEDKNTITWTSDAPSVISVDSNGNATAKGEGTAAISATYRGVKATIQLTAKKSQEGWQKDSKGWWYRNKDGSYAYLEWRKINGKWYFFDDNGYMVTGLCSIDDDLYYMDQSGAMVTGWQKINGVWYYFGNNGVMRTGWQYINNKWYYFSTSGYTIGSMAANKWVGDYYLTSDGSMAVNQWIGKYYVGADGKWIPNYKQSGWRKDSYGWWYQNENGSYPKNAWKKINGSWYYFNENGYMVTGWRKINGSWYYMDGSGAMAANIWIGDYYLTSSGSMAVNQWIGKYYVGADGKWIPNYK